MKEEIKDKIKFDYYDLEGKLSVESVWTSKEENDYRIKNIPFFIPNVAYDYIISVEEEDGELFFDDIVMESGNSTLQVIIYNENDIEEITKKMILFNVTVKKFDWNPAESSRQAFKDEYRRMQTEATEDYPEGYANPVNYNIIQSPGKNYTLQDGLLHIFQRQQKSTVSD
ncbi:hypothetical protein ASF10_19990 [Flavobacterium sp. Leaf82]|uniref:DUF4265 domain-containing protein n=1 Tax=Flavobacterium sp. Leaf82 TaxID=1736238 RepID=UPI0006F6FAB8|nr:DUF4265 domain-containing protein [Flavobacterium sp. Leaf82]KQO32741.1 hypothetical protein ASF10_19990 [Flavobacterium sp. Leaf82]